MHPKVMIATKKKDRSKPRNALITSLLINIAALSSIVYLAVTNRQEIVTALLGHLLGRTATVTSYHLEGTFAPGSAGIQSDYVNDLNKYKQVNLTWEYQGQRDNLHFVYNQDNTYLKSDSRQLRDYLTNPQGQAEALFPHESQDADFIKNLISGESYLHLDKETLGAIGPTAVEEQDILESNKLIRQQIFQSLRLDGMPTFTNLDNQIYLKIPLKIDYESLNMFLYPVVKSFLVSNQRMLKEILDQARLELYMNQRGYLASAVIIIPQLEVEQAKNIFQADEHSSIPDLDQHMVDLTTKQSLMLTLKFSRYNEPVDIIPPENSVNLQELIQAYTNAEASTPITPRGGITYTINNEYPHKPVSDAIFSDFSLIHNMLYRYYSEHRSYPATLDPLAYTYFPGTVPGNVETAQGFSYSTFDNRQGYLLCPTPQSSREYCYKKFQNNEIN